MLLLQLCELYENDCIFDKFDCCMSGDGAHFATGTYSNFFRVVGHDGSGDALLEASRDPTRKRLGAGGGGKAAPSGSRFGLGRGGPRASGRASSAGEEAALSSDLSMKLLHLSWHPGAPVVATAAANSLYIFYGRK